MMKIFLRTAAYDIIVTIGALQKNVHLIGQWDKNKGTHRTMFSVHDHVWLSEVACTIRLKSDIFKHTTWNSPGGPFRQMIFVTRSL